MVGAAPRRSACIFGQGCELIRLMLGLQRLEYFVEFAFHHRIELVEREVDAVIGHSALREL